MYQLIYERSVYKDFGRIPAHILMKIRDVIKNLKENPRPHGVEKLSGYSNRYRVRQGDYRILYAIDDINKIITVEFVKHRKDVYRNLN